MLYDEKDPPYKDYCGVCGEKPHHRECPIGKLEKEQDRQEYFFGLALKMTRTQRAAKLRPLQHRSLYQFDQMLLRNGVEPP